MAEEHTKSPASGCQQLLTNSRTLVLSTLDEGGRPATSYAPYVRDNEHCFYIFISELAAHTRQLLAHPHCALMVIEDEQTAANLFARERFTAACQAELITADDPLWQQQLAALEARFGETVSLLKTLPDFRLFRLKPQQGRYVVGFGKAYEVDPARWRFSAIGPEKLKQ